MFDEYRILVDYYLTTGSVRKMLYIVPAAAAIVSFANSKHSATGKGKVSSAIQM